MVRGSIAMVSVSRMSPDVTLLNLATLISSPGAGAKLAADRMTSTVC